MPWCACEETASSPDTSGGSAALFCSVALSLAGQVGVLQAEFVDSAIKLDKNKPKVFAYDLKQSSFLIAADTS